MDHHIGETDSKLFGIITLLFAGLSAIALNYQQYITSAVLYLFAVIFDLINLSLGRTTGRIKTSISATPLAI